MFYIGSPIHHQQKLPECGGGGSPIHQFYSNTSETSIIPQSSVVKDLPPSLNSPDAYDSNSRSPLHNTSPYASTSTNLGSPVHHHHHHHHVMYGGGQINPLLTSPNNTPTSITSITQGLSGLNTTGSITQGIPPSSNLQLELRQQQSDETTLQQQQQQNSYPSYHVHHILNIHNHRSLTNSPISNPGSPGLDMIQEEMIHQHGCCGSKQDAAAIVCHPQISVTDVLGKF